VPFTVNVGAAYTLPHWFSYLDVSVMADFHDVATIFTANDYTKRNPILNLGIGAEAKLFNFLYLRVGLNEMLPTVGLGLSSKSLHLNLAYYGKELSNEPGGFSTYALELSIAIRPPAKARTWPWATQAVVGGLIMTGGDAEFPAIPNIP
jgi:hypothetical protein